MNRVQLKLVSSLEKVFPDQAPLDYPEEAPLSGLTNETLSFQAAFSAQWDDAWRKDYATLEIESPLKPYIRQRRVRCVPVNFAAFPDSDDNYLRTEPGVYPDLLEDVSASRLRVFSGIWQSVWIDIACDEGLPAGRFPVQVSLVNDEGELLAKASMEVTILDAKLPPQRLIHTKWFHSDCLAQYYGVEVFSEDYWRIVERQIRLAVRRGINMILTPIHTPPLDTRVGGERPTVQLVDVYRKQGQYSFGFEKLERWVRMCQGAGMKYFEMAHLFTQWGAGFTPKIIAEVDGETKRIFGWDVPVGESYGLFLSQYLPALTAELKRLGIDKVSWFHISDEPSKDHLESYRKAKELAEPYLKGFTVMDALSDYAFYQSGAVTKPVPANNHIEGFLHWGFNFYYSQSSDYLVNPYYVTDGDGFAPAGDAFQVYPGRGGEPEESIRMMVTAQALYDLRALELLESLTSRAHVMELIDGELSEPVTFSRYPQSAQWLLNLRARVNREIAEHLK